MTSELRTLFARASRWPKNVQKEAVETLRSIEAGHEGQYNLSAEDRAALARSGDDVRRGKFISERKMRTFFKRARA